MPAGRPKAIKTPKELDDAIEAYAKHCEETEEAFTIIGLSVFMGVARDTLIEYSKTPEYSDSYKKAMTFAEHSLVKNSLGGKYNPTVSIFLLKNNHGYVDKQEVKQDIDANVSIKVEWE